MKYKKIIIIVIVLIIVLLIIYNSTIEKNIYSKRYSEYVEKYAAEYNVDSLLVYSIIKAESNFDENAISNMRCNWINANNESNCK